MTGPHSPSSSVLPLSTTQYTVSDHPNHPFHPFLLRSTTPQTTDAMFVPEWLVRRNEALGSNPPNAQEHISTNASDWLWAAFSLVTLSTLVMTVFTFMVSMVFDHGGPAAHSICRGQGASGCSTSLRS